MADWTYTPTYAHTLKVDAPPTLVSRFEDGTELRRVKNTRYPRTSIERHIGNKLAAEGWLDFFRVRGTAVTFTKRTWDPSEADGAEGVFRFLEAFEVVQASHGRFETEMRFLEVF